MANRKEVLNTILGDNSSFSDMNNDEVGYFVEILKEEMSRRKRESQPVQLRPVVPIEDWIESEYYVGPDVHNLYPYWKQFVVDIFSNKRTVDNRINNVIISGCLTGETEIYLDYNKKISFKDIDKTYSKNDKFTVLTCKFDGSIGKSNACNLGITKYVTKLVDIYLSNGELVRCTPEHRFLLDKKDNNGKYTVYKSAELLKPKDKIKGLEDIYVIEIKLISLDEPIPVYDIEVEKYHNFIIGQGICAHNSIGTGKSCLNENTLVPTTIGCKTLKSLYEEFNNGNRFKVLSESGIKDCIDVYDNGIDDTIIIKTNTGKVIEGTKNHKFKVIRNNKSEWVKLEDIKIGDVFDKPKHEYPFSDKELTKDKISCYVDMTLFCNKVPESILTYSKNTLFEYFKVLLSELEYKGNYHDEEIAVNLRYSTEKESYYNSYVKVNLYNYPDNFTTLLWLLSFPYYEKECFITFFTGKYNGIVDDIVEEISYGRCHTYDLTIDSDHSYCFNGLISHNTVSEIIMLRKLYELSCYKNINALFHLMSKTNIMFLYFSVNKTQALNTGYGEFRSLVDASPYFNENFERNKRLDSLLVFPEGVTFAYGSRSSDAIGMSVICSLLDEANFVSGNGNNSSGNTEKALDMYAGIVNRSNSRFIMDGGINHALNILVSSSTHESSATARQISLSKDDPHTIITAPSQWEVKPDKFSKEFFWVCKGTNYLEPNIVYSVDDINNFRLSEGLSKDKEIPSVEDSFESITNAIEKLPPHLQEFFLKVPVELKRGFEMNIVRSLQDLGGVSTSTSGKLFSSPVVFNECIDKTIHHPFIAQEIVIATGDDIQIKDYLKDNVVFKNREKDRYIHIDQSVVTDSTGITSLYIDSIVEEEGVRKPIFAVDFMLRINPPKPPKKIAIYKIRNFIVYLRDVLGVSVGKVSYDIFNSEESRQILEELGFNVAYRSVDRNDKAYLDLVEIMYEKRIKLYDYPILRYELFNLIHDRGRRKVDHPKTTKGNSDYSGKGSDVGSKDVSDSLAGAVANALEVNLNEENMKVGTLSDFLYVNNGRMRNNGMKTRFNDNSYGKSVVDELIDKEIDSIIDGYERSLY